MIGRTAEPTSHLPEPVCPSCYSELHDADEGLRCSGCGVTYGKPDDIPLLVDLDRAGVGQRQQIEFYDDHPDALHEVMRPWDRPPFHQWLLCEKFRRATDPLASLLSTGATALVVCGGSGLDGELYALSGARVITSDISMGAARRAMSRAEIRGLSYKAVVADATRLPYRDRCFDVVSVHDGLHHLDDPYVGIDEMSRVAREYIVVIEPSESIATRLAVRAGVADEIEEVGNEVRRLSIERLSAQLARNGFDVILAQRYAMFYRDGDGALTRLASGSALAPLARLAHRAISAALSPVGNKLTVVGRRS